MDKENKHINFLSVFHNEEFGEIYHPYFLYPKIQTLKNDNEFAFSLRLSSYVALKTEEGNTYFQLFVDTYDNRFDLFMESKLLKKEERKRFKEHNIIAEKELLERFHFHIKEFLLLYKQPTEEQIKNMVDINDEQVYKLTFGIRERNGK